MLQILHEDPYVVASGRQKDGSGIEDGGKGAFKFAPFDSDFKSSGFA